MSTSANSDKASSWITIAIVIGIGIWFFKGCSDKREERDFEMKGLGMLEAKGIYGEMPHQSGTRYYEMTHGDFADEFTQEEINSVIADILAYQQARGHLRSRGLSNFDLSEIPDRELYEAMRSGNPAKALDDLAKRYD